MLEETAQQSTAQQHTPELATAEDSQPPPPDGSTRTRRPRTPVRRWPETHQETAGDGGRDAPSRLPAQNLRRPRRHRLLFRLCWCGCWCGCLGWRDTRQAPVEGCKHQTIPRAGQNITKKRQSRRQRQHQHQNKTKRPGAVHTEFRDFSDRTPAALYYRRNARQRNADCCSQVSRSIILFEKHTLTKP